MQCKIRNIQWLMFHNKLFNVYKNTFLFFFSSYFHISLEYNISFTYIFILVGTFFENFIRIADLVRTGISELK